MDTNDLGRNMPSPSPSPLHTLIASVYCSTASGYLVSTSTVLARFFNASALSSASLTENLDDRHHATLYDTGGCFSSDRSRSGCRAWSVEMFDPTTFRNFVSSLVVRSTQALFLPWINESHQRTLYRIGIGVDRAPSATHRSCDPQGRINLLLADLGGRVGARALMVMVIPAHGGIYMYVTPIAESTASSFRKVAQ